MNIRGQNYFVHQQDNLAIIEGVLRLETVNEYQIIQEFLVQVAKEHNRTICIDATRLKLINSSGITMLSKFVIHCRKNAVQLTFKWNPAISWQEQSLKNLQRLLPDLILIAV
jgi:hypothetical protein